MKNKKNVPDIRFKGFAEKWTPATLSELSEPLEYGLNAAAIPYDGINKYIRITDIDDSTHLFNYNGLTSPNANLSLSTRYQLRNGDILLARTGASVGKSYHYKDTDGLVYFAGFLIRAHIKSNVNSEFVFQNTLTNEYDKFVTITSQRSGQPGINAQEYSSWTLCMPKQFGEQQAIGNYFQNIDRLINTSQTKLDKLKNIKKACLEKMFPRNGSTTPELRFKGFIEEWKEQQLGDCADIVGGGTPDTANSEYWDGDIDWYSPAEIGDKIFIDRSKRKITQLGLKESSAKVLPIGTVLFSSRAGIGSTAILAKEGATNQGFQSIIPHNGKLDTYFIFSRTRELKKYGETNGAGSTFIEVSGKQMESMPIINPEIDEQKAIGVFFKNLDRLTAKTEQQINKLKNIKKACLDKMFVNTEDKI